MSLSARILHSRWAFRLLLALPALAMAREFLAHTRSWGLLLGSSGDWAIRFLLVTLAVTPFRLLLRALGAGPFWPAWLLKRRRDLGLAAFLYALLHAAIYIVRQSNLHVVLFDMWFIEYALGWAAFLTMLALALTSNDRSVHALGRWWKPLQRLAYLSVLAAALHWYLIRLDHRMLWLHLLPFAALEAFRLWHNFARPAGVKH